MKHVLATLEKNQAYIERFCNPEELTIGVNSRRIQIKQ